MMSGDKVLIPFEMACAARVWPVPNPSDRSRTLLFLNGSTHPLLIILLLYIVHDETALALWLRYMNAAHRYPALVPMIIPAAQSDG